jgi:hypothetical protein
LCKEKLNRTAKVPIKIANDPTEGGILSEAGKHVNGIKRFKIL